ncbi:hypothetical protein C8R44DRAFT_727098 [Mycena epipterygia]|nr:hypothetical protein C8R44DRAFT_727098 [Mycena epipterygia]
MSQYDDDKDNDSSRYDADREEEDTLRAATQDNPESQYNDGAGIKYMIAFQPTHPPLDLQEKSRRKNAKLPDLVNAFTSMHEDSPLDEVLNAVFEAIDHDERTLSYKIVGGNLRTDRFTLTWTIAQTTFKKMQLTMSKHFDDMKEQAIAKNGDKPEPVDMDGRTNDDEGRDKNKRRKLNKEEERIAETIMQIKNAHRCSDQGCISQFCFIGNATAKHVCLTPLHLATWAAAIIAEKPNVTPENPQPPEEEKMFWPPEMQAEDTIDNIELLASCR